MNSELLMKYITILEHSVGVKGHKEVKRIILDNFGDMEESKIDNRMEKLIKFWAYNKFPPIGVFYKFLAPDNNQPKN